MSITSSPPPNANIVNWIYEKSLHNLSNDEIYELTKNIRHKYMFLKMKGLNDNECRKLLCEDNNIKLFSSIHWFPKLFLLITNHLTTDKSMDLIKLLINKREDISKGLASEEDGARFALEIAAASKMYLPHTFFL